jgi:heme/copper-type cytochrome/quinol oxidase subunit 4
MQEENVVETLRPRLRRLLAGTPERYAVTLGTPIILTAVAVWVVEGWAVEAIVAIAATILLSIYGISTVRKDPDR